MTKWMDLDNLLDHCTKEWKRAYDDMSDEQLKRELFGEFKPTHNFSEDEWKAINDEVDSIWESEQYKERGYARSRHIIQDEVIKRWQKEKGG